MRLRALLLAPFVLACGGQPQGECNTSKPCAAGYTCNAANKCELQTGGGGGGGGLTCPETGVAGPANILDNPGFECGDPPSAWSQGFFGTLSKTAPRNGTAAGRWTATATASASSVHYWLTSDIQARVAPGQHVCAAAYVKGSGQNAVVKIQMIGSDLVRQSFAQPLTASWSRIQNSTAVGQNDTGAIFGVGLRQATAGDYIEVDDAAMWISGQPDGGCAER